MMRKGSEKVIAALAAQYPKQTLLALWCDLRKLNKLEFEALVASSAKERPKKPRRPKQPSFEDTPISRIEHLLLTQAALGQSRAVSELKSQLIRQGIDTARIPPLGNRKFGDWLSFLFRDVPASQVMHAALQITERGVR